MKGQELKIVMFVFIGKAVVWVHVRKDFEALNVRSYQLVLWAQCSVLFGI